MAFSREELAAFIVAISFAAGLNVYATVATIGLLSRANVLVLPGELGVLANWSVIGLCAVLFLIEFVVDKVPVVDLIWSGLQGFVRVPVGALLAFSATHGLGPGWQFAAGTVGGAIALAAHSGKTAARAAVTTSPEPWSNFALSTAEDGFSIVVTWFAATHPLLAATIVLTVLAAMAAAIRWVIRLFRSPSAARPG